MEKRYVARSLHRQKLNDAYIRAIQEGKLDDFIRDLNEDLRNYSNDYLTWLYVARAYDARGEAANAANSYAFVLRIARLDLPVDRLLSEVRSFVGRTRHTELLDVIEERFGTSAQSVGKKLRIDQHPRLFRRSEHSSDRTHTDSKEAPIGRSVPNREASPAATAAATRDLVLSGKRAVQAGELEVAVEYFVRALSQGEQGSQTYLALAQTLQRLQRYDDAVQFLDQGISIMKAESRLGLLNVKAQIFQSQGQLSEAAESYGELIAQEKRPAARRFCRLQLASIFVRLGKKDDAKEVIKRVLEDYPQDQVAVRLLATLDKPVTFVQTVAQTYLEEGASEFEVDLPDEGIDFISPMLRRDLEPADFRDEQILLKGGQPSVSDAQRLMRKAEEARGTEFGERYPLFLEAAQAYNRLPKGSYNLDKFYVALTRYSMLRGGAFVSELRRQMLSGRADVHKLRRLRDSATSYYLESVALQVRTNATFVFIPLTNYLRAQVAYSLVSRDEEVPKDLFHRNFSDLFKYCVEHEDDNVARIAYESMVAWGAASGTVWNRLQGLRGGGVIGSTLETKTERSYRILSYITGREFKKEQRPREVLRTSFLDRRSQIKEVLEFFASVRDIALDIQTFRELHTRWQQFPDQSRAILDTDREILDGIRAILTILLPFRDRSPEERNGILFSTRTNVENWLRFIQENPTYWGRVEFEPLLTRWQIAIREIEKRRLSDIQPKIAARLEPPVFRAEADYIQGGVSLRNEGRGTAEGVRLRVQLRSYDEREILAEYQEEIHDEIKAIEGAYHHSVRLPIAYLQQGLGSPYRLCVEIVPIFSQGELVSTEEEFTLQVESGMTFSAEDIPWNEVEIPPEHLFKGREVFIDQLVHHLVSSERNKTYILYGLTRTGKTSILRYLGKELDLKPLTKNGETYRFISFEWRIDRAANQSDIRDMWGYLLRKQVVSKLEELARAGAVDPADVPQLNREGSVKFKDWEAILTYLNERKIYPTFLLDEFSYYRELVDKERIDASFLAAIRDFAISGKASFIFAGTYDLRKLIKDSAYGITGQFVNTIEVQVSRIETEHASNLIRAMEPLLVFTQDAIQHLLRLSYQIPYFIQLLCKYCAIYAMNSGRNVVGFPEAEAVVKVLTGEKEDQHVEGVITLAPTVFSNNMYTPTDPTEFDAVLSTICDFTRGQLHPRMVTYSEIQEVWRRHGVRLQAKLADAIQELTEREILIAGEDEQEFAYSISVDLFRRWWANEHRNLPLELDRLKEGA